MRDETSVYQLIEDLISYALRKGSENIFCQDHSIRPHNKHSHLKRILGCHVQMLTCHYELVMPLTQEIKSVG